MLRTHTLKTPRRWDAGAGPAGGSVGTTGSRRDGGGDYREGVLVGQYSLGESLELGVSLRSWSRVGQCRGALERS